MKILYLGPRRPVLLEFLNSFEDQVTVVDEKIGNNNCMQKFDFIVSYGYRYIVKKPIIDSINNQALNLHISFLPWNRGADPNLWSFLEDTPKGVTIHQIDQGIDTGDIYCQRKVEWQPGDTLRTTYERLTNTIEELFIESWSRIRSGVLQPIPQIGGGSMHCLSDKKPHLHLLTKQWDTPVESLLGKTL